MMAKARILCVDDETQNVVLIDAVLTPLGYEVVGATDGNQALEKVAELQIDLVLLDVMLPTIDGYAVCRKLKSDDRYRKIPVILITALNSKEDRIRGIDAGAEDFISKPINPLEVVARIEMLLEVRRLDRQVESAYQSIQELTTFSKQLMQGYDPMAFDFSSHIEKLTSRLLVPESAFLKAPSEIVISLRDREATNNLVYRRLEKNVIGTKVSGSLLHGFFPKEKPPIGFLNSAELNEPAWQVFRETLTRIGIDANNLVYFHDEDLTVIAVGYPEEATAHNAAVIDNLVLLIMFLKSLSRQIRQTEEAFVYTINALSRASEVNDEDTGNHILRVGEYAAVIAEILGLSKSLCRCDPRAGAHARRRKDPHPVDHPEKACSPDSRGDRNHEGASRARGQDSRRPSATGSGEEYRPDAPRTLGRLGVPPGAQGRADTARRPHRDPGGPIRRPPEQAGLQATLRS